MYYSTRKLSVFFIACLVIGSQAVAQQTVVEVTINPQPGRVVFHSAGDSRYELEAGNIVVFSWGGVELEYYGYIIQAEELRYNKVLQQGSLEGAVVVKTEGLEIRCEKVILDGLAGELVIPGSITGTVQSPEMAFFAGQAKISFPPGSMVEEMSDLSLDLTGGVTIETASGIRFRSKGLVFDGAQNQLSSIGAITIDARSFALPSSGGKDTSITNLEITGQSMVAILDPQGMLVAAEIHQLGVESREVYLEADLASITTKEVVGGATNWDLLIEGDPLSGGIRQERHNLSFSTKRAVMAFGKYGLESLELEGGVEVRLEDSNLHADQVNIVRTKQGYAMRFPGRLTVTFSLYDLGGSELGQTGAIEQWLGS